MGGSVLKCPKCGNKSSAQAMGRMACAQCGRPFALQNPEAFHHLQEAAVEKGLARLSGHGRLHYTRNQARLLIWHLINQKGSPRGTGLGCLWMLGMLASVAGSVFIMAEFHLHGGLIAGVVAFMVFLRLYQSIPYERPLADLDKVIDRWQAVHGLPGLADGTRFKDHHAQGDVPPEILAHPPDRVLIVQRDDLAEMLILNNFHLDNKTFVISANKYPRHLFAACQQLLAKHPQLPVQILRDASSAGARMQRQLLEDPDWAVLRGREMMDLGVRRQDVLNYRPEKVLMPANQGTAAMVRRASGREVARLFSQGMYLPADFAPPTEMLPLLQMGGTLGLALMSSHMMAQASEKNHQYDGGVG